MPRILIIDDQLVLLDTLRMALEDEYDVEIAQNGLDAIEVMDHWQPDVVITDYSMPGMNGIELIWYIVVNGRDRSLRKSIPNKNPRPKIIFYSAMMDEALAKRGREAGADVCLGKPFELVVMREVVRELVKA